ncbi:MAG: FkbM family methyltransferase [Hyphomicrobiales bacterium]|nr:MAG: FkbM family methyltransferase [Hyphomicrobiales bacterium]
MAEDLCLKLKNGTQLFVPNRLDAITTYVILEQERWFEKEWGFVEHLLQPGMVAIDIGANLGIFSMAMAKAVGATGKVYAYEPTSETRARLEKSKAVNSAGNLDVIGSALSDTEREGRIVFGASSELNRLVDDGQGSGEAVHLTSLDLEKKRHGWGEIDFIKMDAEGEELKIVAGGRSVFEADSPVVMFEIRSETGVDLGIGTAFQAIGYGLYRLLPDERHLVPFESAELDEFELNVFAIKPDRASDLAARGLLAEDGETAVPGDWQRFVATRNFGPVFPGLFDTPVSPGAYADGLAAYAGWRDELRSAGSRYAALRESVDLFETAAAETRDVSRLLSLARAKLDAGRRVEGNRCMVEALQLLGTGQMPKAPFLPPTLRHERLGGLARGWLETACLEVIERNRTFSSYYGPAIEQLDWVCRTNFATYELERRRVLSAVRRGQNVQLRKDLGKPAPDHLNAEAWAKLIG